MAALAHNAPLFIPPELVDIIVSKVKKHWCDEPTFSSLSLVSHSWLEITRRHRYMKLQFTHRLPSQSPKYDLYAYRRADPQICRIPLLEALEKWPHICAHVRLLDLSISCPVEASYFRNCNIESGISLIWLEAVIHLLPRLNQLRLPLALSDWDYMSSMTLPLVPHLDLLEIDHHLLNDDADAFNDEFELLLGLFGSISTLAIHGANIICPDEDDTPSVTDQPLPIDTKIAAITVYDHCTTSAGSLGTFARLPNAALLTVLDLTWVPPEDISLLTNVISACKANLTKLALQLEQYRYLHFRCKYVPNHQHQTLLIFGR